MADAEKPLVSVVIPCFNQAKYLGEAIESVLAQSYPNVEAVVIDDGSRDATPEVAQRYAPVGYVRQMNQGLSSARNTGVRSSRGRYLVFLDADDRLLPHALAAGIGCMEEHGDRAFVSGGHRRIDEAGTVIQEPTPPRVGADHYLAFLRGNYVGMHGAVMYQRHPLIACGGFNTSLPACEDYDLYLRLSRKHSVACHDTVVAEYRTYSESISGDVAVMLPTVLKVLRSQRKYLSEDRRRIEAFRAGVRYWKRFYAEQFVSPLSPRLGKTNWWKVVRSAVAVSRYALTEVWRAAYMRCVRPLVPTTLLRLAARLRARQYHPPVGRTRFGDLRRVTPISESFGFDRGLPIDRHYIERFLAEHADDIRGRVLEIGDATYTRRFGGDQVARTDVLHVSEGNALATLIGDLTSAEHIPSNAFDCVIATQTLHLIYDVRAALGTLYRILKPEGVLLLTIPGISQISRDEWGESWYWSFTTRSIRRLLQETFFTRRVTVEAHGNVLAATAFLQGVATGEMKPAELDARDPHYEVLVAARASKGAGENE